MNIVTKRQYNSEKEFNQEEKKIDDATQKVLKMVPQAKDFGVMTAAFIDYCFVCVSDYEIPKDISEALMMAAYELPGEEKDSKPYVNKVNDSNGLDLISEVKKGKNEYAVYRNSLVCLFYLRGELRAEVLSTFCCIRNSDILYVPADEIKNIKRANKEDFIFYGVKKPLTA